jgi:hypothetical protein
LSAVVAKMLAKKPQDRFQTPAEVIAALAPWMGNSSRILAGISRTNLAQGADLQATLSEVARGKTKRLHTATVVDDDGDEVDVESGRETGAVASSITTRERARRPKKSESARKKVYLYAAIGVGVSILGVLGAWAAVGGSKKPTVENTAPPEPEQPNTGQPSTGQPKVTPIPPKAGPTKDVSVYKFDAATLTPFRFRMRGAAMVDGQRGTLPRGIVPTLKNEAEAEFEAGKLNGVPAVTITRHSAALGAQFAFELERDAASNGMGMKLKPNAQYKAVVRYRSPAGTKLAVAMHTLSFGSLAGGYREFTSAKGSGWNTAEVTIHHPATAIRLVVEVFGPAGSSASIASVELFEMVPVDKK